jgi:zinc protease
MIHRFYRSAIRPQHLAFLLSALFLMATATDSYGADTPLARQDPRQMRFDPVQFTPPDPERIVLPNGLVIYLLEDHELPLVTITATMRVGGWLDPADKVGLASLVGITMRTGGTQRMSAEQLDEQLEHLSAQLSVGIGVEAGIAMLDVLKKDLRVGLGIMADVLRRPLFEASRVELEKLQALESIRRRQDRPQSIAGREFAKMLYGISHPLARESSLDSIGRIRREDVAAFHVRYVHPNGVILGVTGDFEKGAMLAALKEVFGDWAKGEVPEIVYPIVGTDEEQHGTTDRVGPNGRSVRDPRQEAEGPPPGTDERIVRFIGKGTSQAHLRVGHLSLKERDPDYPALALLNDILGGGSFRSRLFQDVRTRLGLAYSVGSTLRPGTREPGVWVIRAETKVASAQDVVARVVTNLEQLTRQAVSDAELEEAKEAFVNSFVFSFTSPSSIVSRLISLEYDGLPKDFLQQLRDKVMKLTKEELLRVARVHLHPNRLKILAVGPPETLGRVLSGFGAVEEIKLPPEG